MLRRVADKLSCLTELSLDVVTLNSDFTGRWRDVSSQTLESRRFSCTIDSKQGKALTIVETECCFSNCFNRSATERIILFLEVANSDAVIAIIWSTTTGIVDHTLTDIICIICLLLDTDLLGDNIVVLWQLRGSSILSSRLESHLGAPGEVLVHLKLD